jgi:disulfide bond formation protein DsbB
VLDFGFVKFSQRQLLAAIALACVTLLAFGLYLQHVVGLEPCPMCIVQRYVMVLIAVGAALAAASGRAMAWLVGCVWVVIAALAGAGVAARQSWLQWHPPEVQTCGLDFYGMVEEFPLKRALPMIFRGGGDCTQVDWTFLGGSIANWAFVAFVCMAILAVWSLFASRRMA